MRDTLHCLRCAVPMRYLTTEKIQLGQTGWLLGGLPNLLAGALEAEIFCCPRCGKLEFFRAEPAEAENGIAQVKCPRCGREHDLDDPQCPFCKYDFIAR